MRRLFMAINIYKMTPRQRVNVSHKSLTRMLLRGYIGIFPQEPEGRIILRIVFPRDRPSASLHYANQVKSNQIDFPVAVTDANHSLWEANLTIWYLISFETVVSLPVTRLIPMLFPKWRVCPVWALSVCSLVDNIEQVLNWKRI